jgi:hypothetical protein
VQPGDAPEGRGLIHVASAEPWRRMLFAGSAIVFALRLRGLRRAGGG